jgi:hypothetical protein
MLFREFINRLKDNNGKESYSVTVIEDEVRMSLLQVYPYLSFTFAWYFFVSLDS